MNSNPAEIGLRIKEARKAAKLSQTELADMLNNRTEFKSVEYADGELNAVIADEYCDESIGEESGMSM